MPTPHGTVLDCLGPRWAAACRAVGSNCFDWAHDGKHKNGWVELCEGGQLVTKWCKGSWRVPADDPDVVEMTFGSSRHLCRMDECGCFVVEKKFLRRTGKDNMKPKQPRTRGWISKMARPTPRRSVTFKIVSGDQTQTKVSCEVITAVAACDATTRKPAATHAITPKKRCFVVAASGARNQFRKLRHRAIVDGSAGLCWSRGHVPCLSALPFSSDERMGAGWNGSLRHSPAGAKRCIVSGDCEPSREYRVEHVPDRMWKDSEPGSRGDGAADELKACDGYPAETPVVVELGMGRRRVGIEQQVPCQSTGQAESESSLSCQQDDLCRSDDPDLPVGKQTQKVADFRPSFLECINDLLDEDSKGSARLPAKHGMQQVVRDTLEASAVHYSKVYPSSSPRTPMQNELGESSDEPSQIFPPVWSNAGMSDLDSKVSCKISSATMSVQKSCPSSLDNSLPCVQCCSSGAKAPKVHSKALGSASAESHAQVQQSYRHLVKATQTGSAVSQFTPEASLPPLQASQSAVQQKEVTPVASCRPQFSEDSMSLPLLSLPALESSQRSAHLSQPTPYLAPAIVGSQCKPSRTTDQDAMPQLNPPPLEVDRSASQESLVPPLLVPPTAIEELSQSIPQLSLPALAISQIAIHCSQPTPQVAPRSLDHEFPCRSSNEDVEIKPSAEPPNFEDPPHVDELHCHKTSQFSQSASPPASAALESNEKIEPKPLGKQASTRSCQDIDVFLGGVTPQHSQWTPKVAPVVPELSQSSQIASKIDANILLAGKASDAGGCAKVDVLSLLAIQIM